MNAGMPLNAPAMFFMSLRVHVIVERELPHDDFPISAMSASGSGLSPAAATANLQASEEDEISWSSGLSPAAAIANLQAS